MPSADEYCHSGAVRNVFRNETDGSYVKVEGLDLSDDMAEKLRFAFENGTVIKFGRKWVVLKNESALLLRESSVYIRRLSSLEILAMQSQ